MSSGPHQMNIGWREVRTSRTVTRRLCGHVSGEPKDVFDQSNALVKAPSSPPPARKSLTSSPPIPATSLNDRHRAYSRSSEKHNLRLGSDSALQQSVPYSIAGSLQVARSAKLPQILDIAV